MKLPVCSHCCSVGHGEKYAKIIILKMILQWKGMDNHVTTFLKNCLLCLISGTGV